MDAKRYKVKKEGKFNGMTGTLTSFVGRYYVLLFEGGIQGIFLETDKEST